MQNLGKNTANGWRPRLYGSQIHDSLGIPTDDVCRISFIGPDLHFGLFNRGGREGHQTSASGTEPERENMDILRS